MRFPLVRRAPLLFLLTLLVGTGSGAQDGSSEDSVLGPDGTLYRLSSSGTSLVLDIDHPDGTTSALVVPGTEDPEPERWAHLVLAERGDSLSLVWEDVLNSVHSTIDVAQYRASDGFVDHQQILGSYFGRKLRPQLVVTSDSLSTAEEGDSEDVTVTHVVWREDHGELYYSAIVYGPTGETSVLPYRSFADLMPELVPEYDAADVDAPLVVTAGRDKRSVIAAFVDPLAGSVEVVEVDVLPQAVSRLADAARDAVEEAGEAGADLVSAAENARSHIVFIGRNQVHLAPVLARAAQASVLSSGDSWNEGDWVSVAEDARSHIVFIGLRLNPDIQDDRSTAITRAELGTDGARSSLDIAFRHLRSLVLPEFVPQDASLAVGPEGEHLLFHWATGSEIDGNATVHYTELAAGNDWTPVASLPAERAGSLELARELVTSRVRLRR